MRQSRNLPLSRSQLEEVRTELSHVVQVRAEGPKAPSPGHRPGYNGNQQGAHKHPGRCPGLGASALSGRVGLTCET